MFFICSIFHAILLTSVRGIYLKKGVMKNDQSSFRSPPKAGERDTGSLVDNVKTPSNKSFKSAATSAFDKQLSPVDGAFMSVPEKVVVALPPKNVPDLEGLELLDRDDLIATIKRMVNGGVSLSFHGKRTAMEIARRVRPRITRRISDLHVGTPEQQSKNLLIEGENLQAMVTLYKYRGQIDLIVADPPYNTGQYFRYNDRWDEDPNDPELGALVTLEDGSRHTKWMKAMLPRLQTMKAMLKPNGVVAMCIDDNELFHLGLMMDEVFGEHNRIAIMLISTESWL